MPDDAVPVPAMVEALAEIADAAKVENADPLEWATWAHELAIAVLGGEVQGRSDTSELEADRDAWRREAQRMAAIAADAGAISSVKLAEDSTGPDALAILADARKDNLAGSDLHERALQLDRRVMELEADLRILIEAAASALTSLNTGPAKDGYAATQLREALAASTSNDRGDESNA